MEFLSSKDDVIVIYIDGVDVETFFEEKLGGGKLYIPTPQP